MRDVLNGEAVLMTLVFAFTLKHRIHSNHSRNTRITSQKAGGGWNEINVPCARLIAWISQNIRDGVKLSPSLLAGQNGKRP